MPSNDLTNCYYHGITVTKHFLSYHFFFQSDCTLYVPYMYIFFLSLVKLNFPEEIFKRRYIFGTHEPIITPTRVAIKDTTTVRECGPHAHCADRTPHSKPKKVRTRTVNRTVLLTTT